MEEVRTKRKYTRRDPAVIAAEKAAKEARKAAREAAKKEKEMMEEVKMPAKKTEPATEEKKTTVKKKNSNGQKPVEQKRGQWSNPTSSLLNEKIFVEIKLIEPALGTSPSDKELYSRFIASNAPDATSREEEIAALGEDEVEQKGTTIFMRGWFKPSENGERYLDILDKRDCIEAQVNEKENLRLPYFWNYQIRGFFKDSCSLLARANYGESAKLSAFKKVIDGGVFVHPRRIAIDLPESYYDEDGFLQQIDSEHLPILQRPLRISGPTGERTALASSEIIPAGSSIKFCIEYTDPKNRDLIIEWLNYGSEHGLGAWRNSGRGSFIWRELNPDYSPIDN